MSEQLNALGSKSRFSAYRSQSNSQAAEEIIRSNSPIRPSSLYHFVPTQQPSNNPAKPKTHKNDKRSSPLIDQPKTSAPSTGGRLLRNWRQRSGRGRHLYQGVKVLTNTKGPLAKCSDAPGTAAAAFVPVMPDLADGLGGHKPSRGGALPGLGLKLSCLRVGVEQSTPDFVEVNTAPVIKPTPIDILTDAW